MIINLLCKAFIVILDILLLDFYLKNTYLEVYKYKFKNIKHIVYFIIFVSLLFENDIILHFAIHQGVILLLAIVFNLYHINVFNFTKKIELTIWSALKVLNFIFK